MSYMYRYLDCQRWGSTVVNVISFFLLEINNEILKRIDDSENLHISQVRRAPLVIVW